MNPWINYPYATNRLMKLAADACHENGMKFKVYNTMRELSNRCRELWAMRALRETYVSGARAPQAQGGGVGGGEEDSRTVGTLKTRTTHTRRTMHAVCFGCAKKKFWLLKKVTPHTLAHMHTHLHTCTHVQPWPCT